MAFQADFTVRTVLHVARFPAARVWANFAAAVALDADVTFGVTGLARLQVAPCLDRVLRSPASGDAGCVLLRSASQRVVGLDLQGSLGETAVAGGTVLLVVAAVALLLVVLGLHRMDADEVAAMALWFVVTPGL